jgi:hypothetical protein
MKLSTLVGPFLRIGAMALLASIGASKTTVEQFSMIEIIEKIECCIKCEDFSCLLFSGKDSSECKPFSLFGLFTIYNDCWECERFCPCDDQVKVVEFLCSRRDCHEGVAFLLDALFNIRHCEGARFEEVVFKYIIKLFQKCLCCRREKIRKCDRILKASCDVGLRRHGGRDSDSHRRDSDSDKHRVKGEINRKGDDCRACWSDSECCTTRHKEKGRRCFLRCEFALNCRYLDYCLKNSTKHILEHLLKNNTFRILFIEFLERYIEELHPKTSRLEKTNCTLVLYANVLSLHAKELLRRVKSFQKCLIEELSGLHTKTLIFVPYSVNGVVHAIVSDVSHIVHHAVKTY